MEVILLAACAAILILQIFIPPFTGLANNGDFAKITGRFALGPDGDWESFAYFKSEYRYDPKFYWRSDVLSSEILLTSAALLLAKAAGMGSRFDVRFLGLVHATLFMTAYYIALRTMRPLSFAARFAIGAFTLIVLTDAASITYFNSFYSDTSAFLGLILTIALGIRLITTRPTATTLMGFTITAILMITAKSQHAVAGGMAIGLPLWLAFREASTRRMPLLGSALAIGAAVLWTITSTPRLYPVSALFNIIYYQIAADSGDPKRDLRELGLDERYDPYVGMHAFMADAPTSSIGWLEEFANRTNYGKLARFYLRHPDRAIAILNGALRNEAPPIRSPNLSNFRRLDGRPPTSITHAFSTWSDLRVHLYVLWPAHIIIWYLAVLAGCAVVSRREACSAARPLAVLCACLALSGIFEFLLAALADACETYRHLFLFHTITDLTVCFAFAWSVVTLTDVTVTERWNIPHLGMRVWPHLDRH